MNINRQYRLCFLLAALCILSACSQRQDHYQGYVEGENTYMASSASGILKQLFVKQGEQVEAGQLLYKLDPYPQVLIVSQSRQQLRQAQKVLKDLIAPRRPEEIEAKLAQVNQADAQMKLNALRVKRNEILFARHVVAKDTLDAAIERYQQSKYLKEQYEAGYQLAKQGARKDMIKSQQAQVFGLLAKLKQAQWELLQKNVYAPASGIIFDTYYRVGEYVANQGAVLSLLSPDNVRIEFFVPAQALARLHIGDHIRFTCDGCKNARDAEISYISPEAEYIPPLIYSRENNDKIVFRVKASVKDSQAIFPGQPVMVTITGNQYES